MLIIIRMPAGTPIIFYVEKNDTVLKLKQEIYKRTGELVADHIVEYGGEVILDKDKLPYEALSREGGELVVKYPTKNFRNNNQFFSSPLNDCDWDKPSLAIIIAAFFIPIVGWGYLGYLLYNSICDYFAADNEKQPPIVNL